MEILTDRQGSVTLGWVGPHVYYSRFVGALSAELGAAHTRALESAIAASTTIRYFADSRELTSYDLLARSSFARLLLSKRKHFADIVILNWQGGVSASSKVLLDAVGEPLLLLEDAGEFEKRLILAAPKARDLLRPPQQAVVRRHSGPLRIGTRRTTPANPSHPPRPKR